MLPICLSPRWRAANCSASGPLPSTSTQAHRKGRGSRAAFSEHHGRSPSVEDAIEIVKGLRSSYESHHHVKFVDDVVAMRCVKPDRYISDRYLPDKAIDVIDETGSRVHLARLSPPEEIGRIEAEIQEINRKRTKRPNARISRTPPCYATRRSI